MSLKHGEKQSGAPDPASGYWDAAEPASPQPKEAISLRVDRDVLEWFRGEGPRYQSRMNAVLRSYMTAMENLSTAYAGMAADEAREADAGEWSESLLMDVADEAR